MKYILLLITLTATFFSYSQFDYSTLFDEYKNRNIQSQSIVDSNTVITIGSMGNGFQVVKMFLSTRANTSEKFQTKELDMSGVEAMKFTSARFYFHEKELFAERIEYKKENTIFSFFVLKNNRFEKSEKDGIVNSGKVFQVGKLDSNDFYITEIPKNKSERNLLIYTKDKKLIKSFKFKWDEKLNNTGTPDEFVRNRYVYGYESSINVFSH